MVRLKKTASYKSIDPLLTVAGFDIWSRQQLVDGN